MPDEPEKEQQPQSLRTARMAVGLQGGWFMISAVACGGFYYVFLRGLKDTEMGNVSVSESLPLLIGAIAWLILGGTFLWAEYAMRRYSVWARRIVLAVDWPFIPLQIYAVTYVSNLNVADCGENAQCIPLITVGIGSCGYIAVIAAIVAIIGLQFRKPARDAYKAAVTAQ